LGPWTCWGYEIADQLAKEGSALKFVGPEPALGVSRQNIRRKIQRWMDNQHWTRGRGLGSNHRVARELISRPCLGARARVLSSNRTQPRAVNGLLTGHNTLRRHLHLMRLSESPLCRNAGAEDETSAQILCECEALASFRLAYLGSFLEPEDIKSISLGAIWNFSKPVKPSGHYMYRQV